MNSSARLLDAPVIIITIALITLAARLPSFGAENPSTGRSATMRLDFFHTGNSSQELFSVDRILIEPLPWPGNPRRLIDLTNRGTYLFEIRDLSSGRVLYSRGFASIYGEWVTTAEAKRVNRTFHESIRFPAPTIPVKVVIKSRDRINAFREIWSTTIDPGDKFIDHSPPAMAGHVSEIQNNGDSAFKVDLLFLGEGYAASEQEKCEQDIRRLSKGLFSYSPFNERRSDFNVWSICAPSPDSGVSHPSRGLHRNTLFGSTFDVFGEERYALSFDNRAIRALASLAAYDALGIVMNSDEYGNGGIFGLYATVSIDYPTSIPTFVHEFGHHFADLGDEYYFNANVAYSPADTSVEPWEPNITALADRSHVKWQALIEPGTPIPTPWPKDCYETTSRKYQNLIEKMRAEGRPAGEIRQATSERGKAIEQCFSQGNYASRVGAFAGAMYETKGYYRPQQQCIMLEGDQFCAVCKKAIEEMIDLYSRP
ncbi:MAG: peptidase M64 [Acidobacteria bacterium]|nr:peptidase M64 [Acidobacteriota bacterium]